MSFVLDALVDTDGVLLENHVPDIGGAWVLDPNGSLSTMEILSNQAHGVAALYAVYFNETLEPSDDVTYESVANLQTGIVALFARVNTSTNTYYEVRFESTSNRISIRKRVNGSSSTLDTHIESLSNGVHTVKINVFTDINGDPKIEAYLDGALKKTVIDTDANKITVSGKMGIGLNLTTCYIESLDAVSNLHLGVRPVGGTFKTGAVDVWKIYLGTASGADLLYYNPAAVVPPIMPPITSGTFNPPDSTVGVVYYYDGSILFTGSDPATSYSYNGTLPAGVLFNTSTGIFTGNATTEETVSGLSLVASNAGGPSDPTNDADIIIGAQLAAGLLSIGQIQSIGSYTALPTSAFNSTDGKMALNTTTRSSMFVQGKWVDVKVGEYSIPALVMGNSIQALNKSVMLQDFVTILDRTQTGNPQKLDRIGGMQHINGELMIHLYKFYGSLPPYYDTTVVFRDADNLDTSTIDGFFRFSGHSQEVLWISPVPPEYHALLGGDYISGAATNNSTSINIHWASAGPSAWAMNSADIIGNTLPDADILTTKLLNYGQNHIMANNAQGWVDIDGWRPKLQYNIDNDYILPAQRSYQGQFGDNYDISQVLDNDIWTDLSGVAYGFIVPGTKTYAAFGYMGGHLRGAGYKITTKQGYVCPGPCEYDDDAENYYWFFNVDDLIAVKNGTMESHEVKPYAYDKFTTPFDLFIDKNGEEKKGIIKGGTYDEVAGILYLNAPNINNFDSSYSKAAVIMAFQINLT